MPWRTTTTTTQKRASEWEAGWVGGWVGGWVDADTHLDALDVEDVFEQLDGRLVLGIDRCRKTLAPVLVHVPGIRVDQVE